MSERDTALQQINTIHKTIESAFTTTLSSTQMLVVGALVTAVPAIEYFFDLVVDPLVMTHLHTPYISAILFGLRTIFYWPLFAGISIFTKTEPRQPLHPILNTLFAHTKFFPIIPIATGGLLGNAGYGILAAPMVLILIGTLFSLIGQFTPRIVSIVAWSWIAAGCMGIYLAPQNIPTMWMYLTAAQGLGWIIIGLGCQQHNS